MWPIIKKIVQFTIVAVASMSVIILISIVVKYDTTNITTNTQDNVTDTQQRDQCRFWIKSHEAWHHALISNRATWLCSGALIHKKYVVTLASCVNYYVQRNSWKKKLTVFLGAFECLGCTPYDLENITSHPSYDFESSTDNIAVIQLEKEVQTSFIPGIIPLPDPKTTADKGLELYVSSPRHHGISDIHTCSLLEFSMEVIDKRRCRRLYPDLHLSEKFCAVAASKHYSCLGVNGSPAVVFTHHGNNKWSHFIIGLYVKTRPSECHKKGPELFIDVSSYLNFIKDVMS